MMEEILGSIMIWPMAFTPSNFLPCDGRLLDIQTNSALYSLITTTYGGNGTTNFALPDLRGRVPRGTGTATGLGDLAGVEAVTLLPAHMPPHTHSFNVSSQTGTSASFGNVIIAAAGTAAHTPTPPAIFGAATSPPGYLSDQSIMGTGGMPHNNMQPFLGLGFIICVQGIYPVRP